MTINSVNSTNSTNPVCIIRDANWFIVSGLVPFEVTYYLDLEDAFEDAEREAIIRGLDKIFIDI